MYARSPTRVKRRFGGNRSERSRWSGGGFEAVVPLAVQDAPVRGVEVADQDPVQLHHVRSQESEDRSQWSSVDGGDSAFWLSSEC